MYNFCSLTVIKNTTSIFCGFLRKLYKSYLNLLIIAGLYYHDLVPDFLFYASIEIFLSLFSFFRNFFPSHFVFFLIFLTCLWKKSVVLLIFSSSLNLSYSSFVDYFLKEWWQIKGFFSFKAKNSSLPFVFFSYISLFKFYSSFQVVYFRMIRKISKFFLALKCSNNFMNRFWWWIFLFTYSIQFIR